MSRAPSVTRNAINVDTAAKVGPYSHAIEAGEFLFLSGQTPVDPTTGALVVGNVAVQTTQCIDNLLAVLRQAGLGGGDVVSVQVFLVDMWDFAEMNAIYAQRFDEPFPARTTIGVASLPLGARVEISLVARRSRSVNGQ
jgi:2-iminobutanoate/2-iminopropanoate deaminase